METRPFPHTMLSFLIFCTDCALMLWILQRHKCTGKRTRKNEESIW